MASIFSSLTERRAKTTRRHAVNYASLEFEPETTALRTVTSAYGASTVLHPKMYIMIKAPGNCRGIIVSLHALESDM